MPTIDELMNLAKLPAYCYALIPCREPGDRIVLVKKGERGFFQTGLDSPSASIVSVRALVDVLNDKLGVSAPQRFAMVAGASEGFDKPGANPDHYKPLLH